jgi:hypothetical protein
MAQDFPSRWPVRCPRCAERVMIELPYDVESGRMGIQECPQGHPFLFRYDGVTVGVLGPRASAVRGGTSEIPAPFGRRTASR